MYSLINDFGNQFDICVCARNWEHKSGSGSLPTTSKRLNQIKGTSPSRLGCSPTQPPVPHPPATTRPHHLLPTGRRSPDHLLISMPIKSCTCVFCGSLIDPTIQNLFELRLSIFFLQSSIFLILFPSYFPPRNSKMSEIL